MIPLCWRMVLSVLMLGLGLLQLAADKKPLKLLCIAVDDLCCLDRPDHLQGKSLVPVLKNPHSSHREVAYSSYPHGRGTGSKGVVGHSIRTPLYRYTEWWERGADKVVDAVLSHVEQDPGETTAISDAPEIIQALSDRLRVKVLGARKD
jgi:iduronate 2-sulfatase